MGERLAGNEVKIFGRMRELYSWPIVMLGLNGSTPVPLSVEPDGSVSVSSSGARASNWQLLGSSDSFTIPTTAKAWTVTFLTGTGTIGGKAVPSGFSDSSPNPPAAGIVITTDAASSAYIRYET